VIHGDGLKSLSFGSRGRCRARSGGRHGETANQLAAVHQSLLEIVEQFSDNVFHLGPFH
jgi:hypothetical protein